MNFFQLASGTKGQRRRVLLFSASIMAGVATLVTAITIAVLYRTAFRQERERLVETAQSQARLIEAMARHEVRHYGPNQLADIVKATLDQITDAHAHYKGFGKTGELTLAELRDDHIIFLLSHRHEDAFGTLEHHTPVPMTSKYAEPMRRALRGDSGTVVGLDYRGATVLAAYEPVGELHYGIVAKIDLDEIRAPFVRAGVVTGGAALLVVLLGGFLMLRICNPLIARMETSEAQTRGIVETAADAIITISERGMVESYNAAGERMFGYSSDEIIGASVNILMPSPYREEHDGYMERYLRTDEAHIIGTSRETVARRKDGTIFPVELAVSEVILGDRRMFTGIVTDITERKRTEEALRESEARQSLILSSVPMALYVANPPPAFNMTWASEQAFNLSGYTTEQFLRDPDLWARRIHPDDRERLFREFGTIMEGGSLAIEYRWRCADGAYRWFLDQPVLIRNEKGEPREIIGTWLDIDERKRAEDALRMTQFAVDHAGDAVFWIHPDGRFFAVNEAACRWLSYSREELLTMGVYDIDPDYVQEDWNNAWNEFRARGFATIESHHRSRTGQVFPVEISVNYMEFDGREFMCAFVRDITERQRAQNELRRAKEAAEAASRAKSTFLANMSHEIRTPITAILGAAEILRSPDTTGLTSRQQVDMMLRNGRHLLALIDDLLDISRADAGKLDVRFTHCDLLDIVVDVNAAVQPLRRRSSVDFQILFDTPVPTTITTDPTRLKQAMINLVSNALKFTKTGHIHLRFAVANSPQEPRLSVIVEDTGVGIAGEEQTRIFELFTQCDTGPNDMPEGVGLGLPLCKWIAAQLGGSIDLASTLGRGSCFTLRVATGPLDDADWLTPTEARERTSALLGGAQPDVSIRLQGTILLAEDFKDTRLLIADALTHRGAKVTAVDNGRDAVRQAIDNTFDLILMDVRMPEMDGKAAMKELRRRGCLTPVIALTAGHDDSNRARLMEAGFDDLWPKPISLNDLIDRVASYLPSSIVERDSSKEGNRRSPSATQRQERLDRAVIGFLDTLEDRASRLRVAVDHQDLDEAREILHQLVGAGGIHGFMSLSQAAARLLEKAKNGSLSSGDHSNGLDDFFALVDRVRKTSGDHHRA